MTTVYLMQVEERDIEEMFSCADRDRDGRISYRHSRVPLLIMDTAGSLS